MQLSLFNLFPNVFAPDYGKCFKSCKHFYYFGTGCGYPESQSGTTGDCYILNTSDNGNIEMRCIYYDRLV